MFISHSIPSFSKQVCCYHEKHHLRGESIPCHPVVLSPYSFISLQAIVLPLSLERKRISAQGVLVLFFGSFLHPAVCGIQVQGTFNEDMQVTDQQHYRMHLNFKTAQGEAFKSPGILGCSYRHHDDGS